jgi:glucose 1-dehydrogenase
MTLATAGFTTYVYSRELPPSPRIDLVNAIGATYVSSQTTTFPDLAAQIGNIDLVYEAVGHSHFALQALQVLGTNGIFVMTGVPGLQAFVKTDPARLMREMVLKNRVLLGTVNAGPRPSPPRCEISMPSGGAGRPWYERSSPAVTPQSRRLT